MTVVISLEQGIVEQSVVDRIDADLVVVAGVMDVERFLDPLGIPYLSRLRTRY